MRCSLSIHAPPCPTAPKGVLPVTTPSSPHGLSTISQPPVANQLAGWELHSPLKDVPAAVDRALDAYFDHSAAEFSAIAPEFNDAMAVLRGFVMGGGKRVRPTFAWAGFRAGLEGGGADDSSIQDVDPATVLLALSALEFVQACALIHDDIIDESDTRRGNPTTHRVFESQHRERNWFGSPEHYGISQAILAGDLALSWADDLLATAGLSPAIVERVRGPWRAMRTEVIAGQQLDIALENNGSESIADAMQVINFKTASYTVARPLHIGAALAGADERTIELLLEYGTLVGQAFQLRDDQLGVFGDPAVTGKPSGDDLRTGKRTVLVNTAFAECSPEQLARLREDFGPLPGSAEHTAEQIDRMRQIIQDCGAAQQIEDKINALSERAISLVEDSWLQDSISEELVAFARLLSDRRF